MRRLDIERLKNEWKAIVERYEPQREQSTGIAISPDDYDFVMILAVGYLQARFEEEQARAASDAATAQIDADLRELLGALADGAAAAAENGE